MDEPRLTVETSTTHGVVPGEPADCWRNSSTSYHRRGMRISGGSDFGGRTKLCRISFRCAEVRERALNFHGHLKAPS